MLPGLGPGGSATGVAKPSKGVFARLALPTVVKEANAAVGAKVDLAVFEVYGPFAAGADAFGQPGQGNVVTEFFAALGFGLGFGQLLLLQIDLIYFLLQNF